MAAHATNVLITGCSRGIGLALLGTYLQRPAHTCIAAVRNPSKASAAFTSLPRGAGSKLIVLEADAGDFEAPKRVIAPQLKQHGVDRLDVVIANAGIIEDMARNTDTVDAAGMIRHIQVNALGALGLWQGVSPLMLGNGENETKFVGISSQFGSIGTEDSYPLEYATSKAAMNMIVRQIHLEHKDQGKLCAFVMHPGWVQTDMGNFCADAVGVEKAEISVEESVRGIVNVIDNSTRKATAGRFMTWDGRELPW
ncbi:hypothetical protein KEM55_003022 [Ascosphaera atra]|nr:hypothetical protein KEM55_003022 [Ascosphaera atra]